MISEIIAIYSILMKLNNIINVQTIIKFLNKILIIFKYAKV